MAKLLPGEKLKFENEASTNFHKVFYDKLNNNWLILLIYMKNLLKMK